MQKTIILGINASRARSGGARAHLIGILSEVDPLQHGFQRIHVWSYRRLLNSLPDQPWLIKHFPPETERSILRQLWWERIILPKELQAVCCSILFNVDAGSVCKFRPAVTLSQDLLAFEHGEAGRLGFSKSRLRQILLRYIQIKSLTLADGAIFLTRYAAKVIQELGGQVRREAIIPHGIDDIFKNAEIKLAWPESKERAIRCLYISPVWVFKHQWVVVRAIEVLRNRGYNLSLTLVGGGDVVGLRLLSKQIRLSDPAEVFIHRAGAVPQSQLPGFMAKSDLFVFASSCENMPITLLEAMAVGLPIACSNRGPMPEVLENGGVFFDPENAESIANAIQLLIDNKVQRHAVAEKAKKISQKYSWYATAIKSFNFIRKVYESTGKTLNS